MHEQNNDMAPAITPAEFTTLARFRSALRQFARFSEVAARREQITPQQHQLLLAIAGLAPRGWMTIGEVAAALQLHHNAAVQLVDRAATLSLVRRDADTDDRRVVRVSITALGAQKLARLTALHHDELRRLRDDLLPLLTALH